MKYIIPLLIYLTLFFGTGYLLLKLFSSLTQVDMFNALKWGFKSKKFEIVIPAMLFYLITFVFFFAIITTPLLMSTAKLTQKGGLSGYQGDNYIYKYFDPLQEKYLEIKHYNPPPASRQFNETFTVVSFYKPLFSTHYQNVTDLSLTVSIIKIFFFLIGIIPLYLILFVLAKEFARQINLPQKITHKLISDNFTEITKLNVFIVFFAVIILIAVITITGFIISRNIIREHRKIYSIYSAEYQAKIANVVSPGKKATGRIIKREHTTIKEYSTQIINETVNRQSANYIPADIYTIEFLNILNMPVYLNFQLIGDVNSNKLIAELGTLFKDKKSSVPLEKKEIEFFVNKDFSISLPGQEL
ncbi:MAG: hypothetical protein JXB50_14990 [Spirochaetes bacterium]|nr:hypothetical protein [Spirochaetota bacterium]